MIRKRKSESVSDLAIKKVYFIFISLYRAEQARLVVADPPARDGFCMIDEKGEI